MLVFNQQANIKNVNGAIADIFANRPAPQSTFYLFYSTDTQEIYYDNGTWILIGSGGGGVNIYNSDGTLTSQRSLHGANSYILEFLQLPEFNISGQGSNFNTYYLRFNAQNDTIYTEIVGNGVDGIFIDLLQKIYYLGNFNQGNGTYLDITNNFLTGQNYIKTRSQGNDIGLKLDFANNTYTLGDPGSFNNATTFIINDNNREIITRFNTGNEGIEIRQTTYLAKFGWLNSVNSNHIEFDQTNNVTSTYLGNNRLGLEFDYNTNNFKIGDVNSVANNNYLEIDDTSQLINLGKPGNIQLVIDNSVTQTFKTLLNGNDIGLKLDFANDTYFLTNNDFGLNVDRANLIIKIGEYLGNSNGTSFFIDEVNAKIYTKYFDFNTSTFNDIGLKLDFANQQYILGDINAPCFISVDSINGIDTISNTTLNFIVNNLGNLTQFNVNDNLIKTSNQGNDIGLKLDFHNGIYYYGQLTGGAGSLFIVDDSNSLIYTRFGNNGNGIAIDLASNSFIFGRITGSNTTNLTINDGATYPVEINGTNVLSGTSGGSSGQHLKIKINGVDYKIRLENP